jgi:hypothetical protein
MSERGTGGRTHAAGGGGMALRERLGGERAGGRMSVAGWVAELMLPEVEIQMLLGWVWIGQFGRVVGRCGGQSAQPSGWWVRWRRRQFERGRVCGRSSICREV